METDADRLASIKALGGVLVRHSDGEFWAVFDEQTIETLDGDVVMKTRQPELSCVRTSDVDRLRIQKDDVLEIGARVLRVKEIEPDGTGASRIGLRR